jgi:2-methylcitrate dehydratase PrpD
LHNPVLRLADAAAAWQQAPLRAETERHARRALFDWFAALFPGCAQPPATLLAIAMRSEGGAARSICYVDGSIVPLRHAALINATASHTVEFDDIYRDAGYHPACPTISAALAAAQATSASMDGLLRAIVAGYEVSCRIALAVQPSHYRYWHTTGTVGTFGAAVATALLLGCDAPRIAHAITTAATFAAGLQQALRGEGMSKPLHPGHAADAGALAAMAAAEGITGSLDILHGEVGFAAATSVDTGRWDHALEGLGEWLAIHSMTFKNHGCCGHIFPSLDAVRFLQGRHRFAADDIVEIRVGGYSETKRMCDRPNPTTEHDARFSTQYCIAAMLILGAVRLAAFDRASLIRSDIRAILPKVTVNLEPELVDAYPARRAANVTITLKDGRRLFHHQPTRKGDPELPLSDEELIAKFQELAVPFIGEASAAALQRCILHENTLPGLVPLLDRSARSPAAPLP